MNRLAILSAAVAMTLSAVSCTQNEKIVTLPDTTSGNVQPLRMSDDASPATQPALPAGHPAVGDAKQPALPSGHPQIPQAGGDGALPSGHPQIPPAGGVTAPLPSGHPDISQVAPKLEIKPIDVTFNIQALQQTKDAKPIGALSGTIEFVLQNQRVGDKVPFTLDDKGAASVPAKGAPAGAVGYISVTHQDVEYHAVSAPLDAARPETKVGIGVFEATETKPEWQVAMQHVILTPDRDGLHVTEMVSVENPTDRTWLGTPGADGKRSTVTFPVPATSGDILPIEGFQDGFIKLEGDLLINQLPLTPGATQYRISYTIPYTQGKASMSYKTTSNVKHMMVFLPNDGTQADVKGLQSMGEQEMNGKKIRAFMGMNLSVGAPVDLTVSQPSGANAASVRESSMPAVSGGAHLETSASAGVPTTTAALTVQIAKAVAVAGTVLVLLLAGALMLAKPNKLAKSK